MHQKIENTNFYYGNGEGFASAFSLPRSFQTQIIKAASSIAEAMNRNHHYLMREIKEWMGENVIRDHISRIFSIYGSPCLQKNLVPIRYSLFTYHASMVKIG